MRVLEFVGMGLLLAAALVTAGLVLLRFAVSCWRGLVWLVRQADRWDAIGDLTDHDHKRRKKK